MKIGLDIHGVIDTDPLFFSVYTKALVAAGHEVHILTGPKFIKVKDFLEKNEIKYTHFFSIVESVDPFKIRWEDENNPWIDTESWNRAKSKYCEKHGIDMHMDDSDVYGQYFKTPYVRFYGKKK